jgi:ATP-dependent Zn protease
LNLEPVAIHEAGHGVVAYLLLRPLALAIYPNGTGQAGPAVKADTLPLVQTRDEMAAPYQGRAVAELLDDAVIIAGGCVAEAIMAYDPVPTVRRSDRVALDACCRELFPDADHPAVVAFGALAVARARSLLAVNWPKVERVAAALLEKRYLPAVEIDKLML